MGHSLGHQHCKDRCDATSGCAAESSRKPLIVVVSKSKRFPCPHFLLAFMEFVCSQSHRTCPWVLKTTVMFEHLLNLLNSPLGYLKGRDREDRLHKLEKKMDLSRSSPAMGFDKDTTVSVATSVLCLIWKVDACSGMLESNFPASRLPFWGKFLCFSTLHVISIYYTNGCGYFRFKKNT